MNLLVCVFSLSNWIVYICGYGRHSFRRASNFHLQREPVNSQENDKTGIQVRNVYLFLLPVNILIPRCNFSFSVHFIAVLYTILRHHNRFHISFLSLYTDVKTLKPTKKKKKKIQPKQDDINKLCNGVTYSM